MSTATATETRIRIKQPSLYKVMLHNDDFTPMEFVIQVLIEMFGKSLEEAHALTILIHERGKGQAGIYSKEVAEAKQDDVMQVAQHHGHPLKCTIEEA